MEFGLRGALVGWVSRIYSVEFRLTNRHITMDVLVRLLLLGTHSVAQRFAWPESVNINARFRDPIYASRKALEYIGISFVCRICFEPMSYYIKYKSLAKVIAY
jgi:hypothetical protein